MKLNISIRLKLAKKPGTLAKALEKIAAEHGNLGAIDLVSAAGTYIIRDIMVGIAGRDHVERLTSALNELPGVEVIKIIDRIYAKHMGGKIEIKAKREVSNREDLSLVYTPGVARVSSAIHENEQMAYKLTMKGNTVAIVTDGSAVLGLGNIGSAAALPVMEGKALLFKSFAGVDAFPLCLKASSPEDIVSHVKACAPGFGGINLEDIAAPKCFEIEERLKQELDIPVFHDDQHGTAIVTLAGLFNALKVRGTALEEARIVISGAGAAGTAICKLLLRAGAREIIVCDSKGALGPGTESTNPYKQWLAENTNFQGKQGNLKEVLSGADVLIGVSAPNILGRGDIKKMNKDPIVFALANPDPEVEPEEIYDLASIVATGRSDFPNQINNVLAFPGVFRGALDCYSREINTEMCLAAARALSQAVSEKALSAENVVPSIFQEGLSLIVAEAVKEAAQATKVARVYETEAEWMPD